MRRGGGESRRAEGVGAQARAESGGGCFRHPPARPAPREQGGPNALNVRTETSFEIIAGRFRFVCRYPSGGERSHQSLRGVGGDTHRSARAGGRESREGGGSYVQGRWRWRGDRMASSTKQLRSLLRGIPNPETSTFRLIDVSPRFAALASLCGRGPGCYDACAARYTVPLPCVAVPPVGSEGGPGEGEAVPCARPNARPPALVGEMGRSPPPSRV